GLPPTVEVAQAIKLAVSSKARLLQRFLSLQTRQAARFVAASLGVSLSNPQAGRRPGLLGAQPLDPGQALAGDIKRGRCVEVCTFRQYPPLAIGQPNTYQTMLDALIPALLLYRQDSSVTRIEHQVAVAAIRLMRNNGRFGPLFERLKVNLLVPFIDIGHTAVGQTEGAAAIFVNTATQGNSGGRQAPGLSTIAPEPEGATGIRRVVLDPEQTAMAGTQFRKVATGAGRPLRRPVAGPEAIRQYSLGHRLDLQSFGLKIHNWGHRLPRREACRYS